MNCPEKAFPGQFFFRPATSINAWKKRKPETEMILMEIGDIFEYVNGNAPRFLVRDKSGKGFVCPVCGSGSGPNGTGITENPRNPRHFTCWGGDCFRNASLSDMLAVKNGIDTSDAKAVAINAAKELGIRIDGGNPSEAEKSAKKTAHRRKSSAESETAHGGGADFFEKCRLDLGKTDYWKKRGLTKEIADKFNLGFCAGWRHPKTPSAPPTDRLIIPTGGGSYLARATDPGVDRKYGKQKVGPARIFNARALTERGRPVFVVEGEIDAMSVEVAGGRAVGLGSLSMLDALFDEAEAAGKAGGFRPELIIALDNDGGEDGAGNKAQRKAEERTEELLGRGLGVHFADAGRLFLGKKDANDALVHDSSLFKKAVEEAERTALAEADTRREEELSEIRKDSALSSLPLLMKRMGEPNGGGRISTGFCALDGELDGGLYPGLYIIGAISSLGKTTFCLQMADQIAKGSGRDVLVFSLEMSREELMAKSVSRLTAEESLKANGNLSQAKSTRGILSGERFASYSESDRNIIARAIDEYRTFAGRIYIHEGNGETTSETIRRVTERHASATGNAPVVLIDYLQIIDPDRSARGLTDKQATDRNVKALKSLSRDLEATVVCISSFNRDNYSSSVNMASFKESGAIEYSSDVLMGLQYKEMDGISKDGGNVRAKAQNITEKAAKDAKSLKPVRLQLKIIKNRNGSKGSVDFDFYPAFNRFEEPSTGGWIKKS